LFRLAHDIALDLFQWPTNRRPCPYNNLTLSMKREQN